MAPGKFMRSRFSLIDISVPLTAAVHCGDGVDVLILLSCLDRCCAMVIIIITQ